MSMMDMFGTVAALTDEVLLARVTLGERLTRAQALCVVCSLVAVALMVAT